MIAATLVAVGAVLAAGVALGVALPRLRRLRTQLIVLCIVAVLAPVLVLLVEGSLMLSSHDAVVLALVSGASALAAVGVAIVLVSRVAGEIELLRSAAGAMAAGDLAARVSVRGPAEVRALARSFNEMAASLGRLIDTRRNLVAWASHDLRAPLASLQAMIEAVQDGLVGGADYLPEMRRQVRVLSALVDDLFELSRIETGALELELLEVPLDELAAGVVRSVRPQAEARRVRLDLATDGTARARCAPEKIERVLMNLLTNALRHTPYDGSVAVRVGADGSGVTIAVEDSGEGIPDGAAERVFESFWRADASRTGGTDAGAGLGLAISRGLVEAHGGRIWAENRPEGGARFVFTIPAA